MTKKIIFSTLTGDDELNKLVDIPKPTKNFIPQWWKNQKFSREGNSLLSGDLSFKACAPFLDSLTAGYVAVTHQDLYVEQKDGSPYITWNDGPEPIFYRGISIDLLPVPSGCSPEHFVWHFYYGYKLPKGYSALFTHPLNRFDLPFQTVSGIVDEGIEWSGQVTFWLKKDFTGIIPMGTPIVQIIPFKTESWESERQDFSEESKIKKHQKLRVANGYYKKFIRSGKNFK